MPDAHEAARQNVLDEATQKLHGGERHRTTLITMGVVLPLEGDVVAIEGEQPMMTDRDPMGVAPQVAEDGGRPAEGRFRVDHPVGLEERVHECPPRRRFSQVLAATGEIEVLLVVRASERLDRLPAKNPAEDLHREEEARIRRIDPALVIGGQATGRHDAVHVRVTDQGLPPRVQDAQHANLRPEVARVSRHFAERRRARVKEPRVQDGCCSGRPAAGVHAGA